MTQPNARTNAEREARFCAFCRRIREICTMSTLLFDAIERRDHEDAAAIDETERMLGAIDEIIERWSESELLLRHVQKERQP